MSKTRLASYKLAFFCMVVQCASLLPSTAQGQATRFDVGSDVLLVGDSFTNGSTEWAARVNGSPEFSVDIFSDGGRTLNNITTLIGGQYQADTYDAVVVAAGVNDVLGGRSVDQIRTSIESIISQVENEHIVLTTIAPFGGSTSSTQQRQDVADDVNSWIFSIAARSANISVFDVESTLDINDDQIIDSELSIGDGLHPGICSFDEECGSSVIADSFINQFSVAAVPEPSSTMLLLLLLSLGLGIHRRK